MSGVDMAWRLKVGWRAEAEGQCPMPADLMAEKKDGEGMGTGEVSSRGSRRSGSGLGRLIVAVLVVEV